MPFTVLYSVLVALFVGTVVLAVFHTNSMAENFLPEEPTEIVPVVAHGEETIPVITTSPSESPELPVEPEPSAEPEQAPETESKPIPDAEPEQIPDPEPESVATPDPEPDPGSVSREPSVYRSDNAELFYNDGTATYHLILTFYRSVDGIMPEPAHLMETEVKAWNNGFTFSQFFVADANSGLVVNESFLEKVEHFEVNAIPQGEAAALEIEGPLINDDDPLALRSARLFYYTESGSNLIRWTITMKNGDVITLQHTLSVTELLRYVDNVDERQLSREDLESLKDADAATLQEAISTVADASAYLDLFKPRFFDALNSDFKLDIDYMLSRHRTENTGCDVYTAFAGWCLADDYPETKYLVASGSAGSYTWIYHGLLIPDREGYRVVSPAAHSNRWNCVWGFDEVEIQSMDELQSVLTLRHDGMPDDTGLVIYQLFELDVGATYGVYFWQVGDYLTTNSDAIELFRN